MSIWDISTSLRWAHPAEIALAALVDQPHRHPAAQGVRLFVHPFAQGADLAHQLVAAHKGQGDLAVPGEHALLPGAQRAGPHMDQHLVFLGDRPAHFFNAYLVAAGDGHHLHFLRHSYLRIRLN